MKLSYYEYVKNYFIFNYFNYRKEISDDNYGGILINVTSELGKKCSSIDKVKKGEMDEFINQHICKYLNKLNPTFKVDYTNLYNAVRKYLEGNYLYNSNENTVRYFSKKITLKLISDYNYLDLNKGLYDDKIKVEYNNLCIDLRNRIENFIINSVDLLDGINQREVASVFVHLIISDNKYDIKKYFDGSYDKVIYDMCIKNRIFNDRKKVEKVKTTIKELIMKKVVNKNKLNEIVNKIYDELIDNGYSDTDILGGRVNNYIINLCYKYNYDVFKPKNNDYVKSNSIDRNLMKKQSVINNSTPNKFRVYPDRKKINRMLATLLVVGTLVGSASGLIYNTYNKYNYNKAISTVNEWEGYDYSNIYTIYTDAYKPTAKNVVDKYDDYASFENDDYEYLGFYRAYSSVKQDRLYIMDNMLKFVKSDDSENGKQIKEDLKTTSCYLEFMYDRLIDMGYTGIDKRDFNKLLDEYLKVKNEHRGSEAVQYLSSKSKRLVEKIRDKYIEYSEKYLEEFGNMLMDNETLSTKGKGR